MKIFFLGVLAIALLGVAGFLLSPNKTPKEEDEQPAQQKETIALQELQIEEIVMGEGEEAVPGKLITVHYTGTLLNGSKFDSSLDRGEPFQFTLGAGQVIQGWEQGFEGMRVGGTRKLIIPAKLAYGASSGHPLQQETLIFQVELLDVAEE